MQADPFGAGVWRRWPRSGGFPVIHGLHSLAVAGQGRAGGSTLTRTTWRFDPRRPPGESGRGNLSVPRNSLLPASAPHISWHYMRCERGMNKPAVLLLSEAARPVVTASAHHRTSLHRHHLALL